MKDPRSEFFQPPFALSSSFLSSSFALILIRFSSRETAIPDAISRYRSVLTFCNLRRQSRFFAVFPVQMAHNHVVSSSTSSHLFFPQFLPRLSLVSEIDEVNRRRERRKKSTRGVSVLKKISIGLKIIRDSATLESCVCVLQTALYRVP